MQRRWSRVVVLLCAFIAALLAGAAVHADMRLRAARTLWSGARAPVIIYHDLLPAGADRGPLRRNPEVMSVTRFATQMDELARNGFHPVTLAAYASGATLPPKPVLITFDDGYESTYTYAYPILRHHGFPATLFLITGRVGRPGYLTWAEVRAMRGLISFGGHTNALHYLVGRRPVLDLAPAARVLADLRLCRRRIAEHVGVAPTAFAYPFGAVTPRTASLVHAAGFSLAFAGQRRPPEGVPPRYAIPRFPVLPHMAATEYRLFALDATPTLQNWTGLIRDTFVHGWGLVAHRL